MHQPASASEPPTPPGPRTAGLLVAALTLIVLIFNLFLSFERYRLLRSGWPWDLAYYNQWAWSLTHGDGTLTVRPLAAYATEGPSAWKTNYLAPIRYLILPIYALHPEPRTLLAIQCILFWLVLPAAYGLVRSETRSIRAGLLILPLVLLTPLLWPLALNDFRELQLAIPFALFAVRGVRERSIGWTALGVMGLLACRQEYAMLVASLAVVPPQVRDPAPVRFRWAAALWFTGLGWFLIVFFGFLVWTSGPRTPSHYLDLFGGPRPGWLELAWAILQVVLLGLGPWLLLGAAAPRVLLIALPWLWSLVTGRWAMRMIGTLDWHHVRYTAPYVASGLAAGLIGASRIWRFARWLPQTRTLRLIGVAWTTLVLLLASTWVLERFARIPYPISPDEAATLWTWFRRVAPDDGVLAHYDVTAPLSSRRELYSYVLHPNEPPGYPDRLPASVRWVFSKGVQVPPQALQSQGFRLVHAGPVIYVWHRPAPPPKRTSDSITNPDFDDSYDRHTANEPAPDGEKSLQGEPNR
ncbi:MAG: hypothetical protein KatS3mg108_2079 [Isosphaeraceae bacterium]|jgi:uncharacterized membrane protein|nr:MAG: hypothetical protein KatS3mg108_2079 [Isosphaeraceae bacterium]